MICGAEYLHPDFGCDLAHGHGGPHFSSGVWWWEQDEPPDWAPPRFTVAVEVNGPDRVLHTTIILNPDGATFLDLGGCQVGELKFKVHRLG